MQGLDLHGVENKILLVSYNIKLTKVIMMLSVSSFQNAINLGQNSIIATIFPQKNREPPQFIAEHTMYVNFIFVNINLGLRCHIEPTHFEKIPSKFYLRSKMSLSH